MMANILVTGGAGFIGSHLVPALLTEGHEVVIVDDFSTGNISNTNSSWNIINSRVEDIDDDVFRGIDIVYHLAAIAGESVSIFAPDACYKRNILGSYNIIMKCLKNKVRRVIFSSSIAIYGNVSSPPFHETDTPNPTDPYGLYKYETEKLLEIYGSYSSLEWIVLRLHSVYGPRINLFDPYRNVVSIFINLLLRKKPPLIYGDGKQVRAFTYVDDIIPLLSKFGVDHSIRNEVFNVGSDEITSINDLAYKLIEYFDIDIDPIYKPLRAGEICNAYTNIDKARKLFNFSTSTSLEEGLIKTITWARNQGKEFDFNYDILDAEFVLKNILPEDWKKNNI